MRSRFGFVCCLGLALVGCTIDRDIPLERFACGRGGPCADAAVGEDVIVDPIDGGGDAGGEDGGGETPDLGAPDAGAIDSGAPAFTCASAIPMPANGIDDGSINNESNEHNAFCAGEAGGRDIVYYFITPGRLLELYASTDRSGIDSLLYLYRTECNFGTELACNDDSFTGNNEHSSEIRATDLAPGAYYLVLDMYNGNTTGNYALDVRGRIAVNEPCDPALEFLTCDRSVCLSDGTGYRCTPPLDCRDLIDTDFDMMVDEDQAMCMAPPEVTCPPDFQVLGSDEVVLDATAADPNGTIVQAGWELVRWPHTEHETHLHLDVPLSSTIAPELVGQYRMRFLAVDDDRQASACETAIHRNFTAALRVEVVWEPVAPEPLDMDLNLHMLSPAATAWFMGAEDCHTENCDAPPWGAQHFGPQMGRTGPEVIEVENPLRDGSAYRVGVHFIDDLAIPPVRVWLRIHCDGATRPTIGPAMLELGDPGDPDVSDFWKAADIVMDETAGCVITPLNQVVTGLDARMMR